MVCSLEQGWLHGSLQALRNQQWILLKLPWQRDLHSLGRSQGQRSCTWVPRLSWPLFFLISFCTRCLVPFKGLLCLSYPDVFSWLECGLWGEDVIGRDPSSRVEWFCTRNLFEDTGVRSRNDRVKSCQRKSTETERFYFSKYILRLHVKLRTFSRAALRKA